MEDWLRMLRKMLNIELRINCKNIGIGFGCRCGIKLRERILLDLRFVK